MQGMPRLTLASIRRVRNAMQKVQRLPEGVADAARLLSAESPTFLRAAAAQGVELAQYQEDPAWLDPLKELQRSSS